MTEPRYIQTNRTDLPEDASIGLLRQTKMWGVGMLRAIQISFKNWFRGPITVQYPFERLEDFDRSRWEVELILDEDGNHKCTACLSCERACSHHCIHIQVATGEDRSKTIEHWKYESGACINCGLCVEACPFGAIRMNHNYELAEWTREELMKDLIVNQPAAKPKRAGAPAAGAAAGAAKPAGGGLTPEEKAKRIAEAQERMAAKKAAEAEAAAHAEATASAAAGVPKVEAPAPDASAVPEIKLTPETPEEVLKESDPLIKEEAGEDDAK